MRIPEALRELKSGVQEQSPEDHRTNFHPHLSKSTLSFSEEEMWKEHGVPFDSGAWKGLQPNH